MHDLKGKVAIVTGASRGVGREIALVLGEAGATVYVTGRSVRGRPSTENLPGTIEETSELAAARGGVGIPVRCDHTVDAEVEALFDRVRMEKGRLDLLVNNVWGGYEGHDLATFGAPFWEQPLRHWERMFVAGVRAHFVASRLAVPLMLQCKCGLIINTTLWDRDNYLGNLFYDVAKAAVNRMAFGMAHELRAYRIVVVALSPGFVRSDRVMAAHAAHPFDLGVTESPQYIGRAAVALAADPGVMEKSGRILTVGDLAREYRFTDIDGRQVPPFRFKGEQGGAQ